MSPTVRFSGAFPVEPPKDVLRGFAAGTTSSSTPPVARLRVELLYSLRVDPAWFAGGSPPPGRPPPPPPAPPGVRGGFYHGPQFADTALEDPGPRVDIEMPRLDGFNLTEKLRQIESYKRTPIIIVSSRDREQDKRRGMQVGADAYIIKGSFDQSNLLSTIQSLAG